MKTIKIQNKTIGEGHPVFIVAELGVNHNGDFNLAKKMITEAEKCGADAVKLQSFIADEFISDKTLAYTYKSQGKEITETQYKMFKRLELSKKAQKDLFDFAKQQNIILFSTPQDNTLEIDIPAIKIGSDDLTNLSLLAYYAKKKKPMIIATGMSTIDEIVEAVKTIQAQGNEKIIILKCTSQYPTLPEECNLNQIKTLQNCFNAIIGYSDHTQGTTASIIAVILGAKVIEKHFTLNKEMPGPDHWFSADPIELNMLVKQVREAEKMLGKTQLVLSKAELLMKRDCRRSITAGRFIQKGKKIEAEDLKLGRPGMGFAPKFLPFIIGRQAKKDFQTGEIIII